MKHLRLGALALVCGIVLAGCGKSDDDDNDNDNDNNTTEGGSGSGDETGGHKATGGNKATGGTKQTAGSTSEGGKGNVEAGAPAVGAGAPGQAGSTAQGGETGEGGAPQAGSTAEGGAPEGGSTAQAGSTAEAGAGGAQTAGLDEDCSDEVQCEGLLTCVDGKCAAVEGGEGDACDDVVGCEGALTCVDGECTVVEGGEGDACQAADEENGVPEVGCEGALTCVDGECTVVAGTEKGDKCQTTEPVVTCESPLTCKDGVCKGSAGLGEACDDLTLCTGKLSCLGAVEGESAGICAHEGKITVTLSWMFEADLDLHVTTPADNEIYYADGYREFDGGHLDVDDCRLDKDTYLCTVAEGPHVENVYFDGTTVASGTYTAWAKNGISDGSVDYTLTITVGNDDPIVVTGTLASRAKGEVQEFTY